MLSVVVASGLIIVAAGWPGRCRAGAEARDLSGRVVDRAGVAVPGVPIWAIGGEREHPRVVAKTTTDTRGRFVLPPLSEPPGPQDSDFLEILAIDRDGRFGWRLTGWPKYPQPGDLRIVLDPVGEVRGRVQDHEGRPIAAAEITTNSVYRIPVDHPGPDSIEMPTELAAPFRATTAADGTFAIKGVPERAELETTIASPGSGDIRVFWDTTRPVTIVLDRRSGRVEGQLESADGRGLPGEPAILLRSTVPPPGPVRVYAVRTATVGKDGSFRFDRVPPGTYELHPAPKPGAPYSTNPIARVEVRPDAVAQVQVRPDAVARLNPRQGQFTIAGRVVDARTGRGIKGVGVRPGLLGERNSIEFGDQAETDADGRYTVVAPRGNIQMRLNPVPKDHIGLRSSLSPTLEVRGDRTWPDLKLDPAVALDGVVVDGTGKPVASAQVYALPANTGSGLGDRWATTGPDGTFHFDQIDPDDTLPLWARTRDASTDGVVVIRPGELKEKLTLKVDPAFAVRIRGRVTDRSGKRLAGARAVVWWNRRYVSGKLDRPGMGLSGSMDTATTDESGWFVVRNLWPGDRYKVVIEADDYSPAEPPEFQGRAGETHDLGTTALTRAGEHIDGRVVGSDGRPIAGATVFNRGDAPMPLETRTGPDGRFRLDSLFPGTKYAFARKDGYRFTGVTVEGEADDLTITLLKTDEPPPAWKPGAGPTFEAQRAFARDVLVRIWEKFGKDAEKTGASACIPAMARIDLDLALQWSAERGHQHDARAREAAAEELAATDAAGALELLGLVDGRIKVNALQRLAERFVETDPRKALMFAEETVVQGRSRPQPDRTWALAEAGEVLVRLGHAEAGRKLIDEAAADAARLNSAGLEGYARATAARTLAPFDLDRALKLVEPSRESRYNTFIADAIAATNPDRAAALVDAASSPYLGAEVIRTKIAVFLGPNDPDRAIRMIEGMKSSAAEKYGAEGFAWVAVAVAPRHRARSVALIDRALSVPVDRPEVFQSWMNFGGGLAAAAHIAASARHAGYPDMDSVIMRVMASRTSPGILGFSDPGIEITMATTAAVPLALVDPGAARMLLTQIEARSGLDSSKLVEVARFDWLRAWSLVDLEKTGSLVDAQLAAIEKANGAGLRYGPIFRMIDILVIPPDRREATVFQAEVPSWRPAFQH
jgi:hypothetical protein